MIYFDCKMGAAGDMIMASLYELMNSEQKAEFLSHMNTLFPVSLKVTPVKDSKAQMEGTHMVVEVLGQKETPGAISHEHDVHEHHHEHHHYTYQNILSKISSFTLPDTVKNDISAIYQIIGQAEAKVHESTLENIHFHEVGSLDAICDVTGAALAFYMLNDHEIYSSPIHVGNGTVTCAHGILPVPAPATKEILGQIPYYKGEIASELCTPTGAAILKYYVKEFINIPELYDDGTSAIVKTGIGTGHKDFDQPNVLKTYLLKKELLHFTEEAPASSTDSDQICALSCNIDDMTGEELGYAMDCLLEENALDVYYQPIYMKKNRPAVILTVLCKTEEKEKFSKLIFQYTSTRGLRYQFYFRDKLESSFQTINTEFGRVRKKISKGKGLEKSKYEYEDVKNIAKKLGTSIDDAEQYIKRFES